MAEYFPMRQYIKNSWNTWTPKSSGIPYKSSKSYIGDGEEKLGKEFDTKPLGQNDSHDLNINNEKWEVKKLDSGKSFRLGVEIASKYNDLLYKLIGCFDLLNIMKEHLVSEYFKKRIIRILDDANTSWGTAKTPILKGLYKNEVGELNLLKLDELLEELKEITFISHNKIKLYSSYDGEIYEYTSTEAAEKIHLEKISIDKKIKIFGSPESYDQNLIRSKIQQNLEMLKDQTLKEYLNKMVREVFDDLTLVIVDKRKGFMPISSIEKVSCYRITSGSPRCRIKNLD
jgi:hypothetical protein